MTIAKNLLLIAFLSRGVFCSQQAGSQATGDRLKQDKIVKSSRVKQSLFKIIPSKTL